jgi:hypothetical protein
MASNNTTNILEAWSSEYRRARCLAVDWCVVVLVGFLTGIIYWEVGVCAPRNGGSRPFRTSEHTPTRHYVYSMPVTKPTNTTTHQSTARQLARLYSEIHTSKILIVLVE